MATRIATAAAILCVLFWLAAQADPAHTVRAGEWETRTDGGKPDLSCLRADRTFDRAIFARIMALSGTECATGTPNVAGAFTSQSATCDIGGRRMTIVITITATVADAYTIRTRLHDVGGQIKKPDTDLTQTARRLGACKPRDKPSPF